MKATMVKFVSVIAIVLSMTGCGSLAKVFGGEVLDVVKDDMSVTTIKQVGEDEYVFEVEASEEALKKMADGEGIKEMTITIVVDEARKDEFVEYMKNEPAFTI